ncbi:mandelate racemase/muconate lactonizing enzyme family protein (plasmid) [Rhizobium oryzihabitans]|jgi:L-alanine-DL-glutamate epimerase-like enolase superfamily enzyme|uniref:Mandelate racemase/muconate lactonizing enzyme family protein n=1 Tax=Rhizobium oryzihabitans TaxID=2267833 RepID=A0A7L5BR49_9HYPH|nr:MULTISPECIES: mandelate racemase/muconate lactonizing enzyme family protein [Rhizobiaceae]QIB41284.1 mandelate racemase/muconate lactonizing enzyme family protein [Rhizobium oryzihabitans]QIB41615.1 mandelate racemase/muconate lactonizing enzyme family protein [Rhizobium oryzihabitans]TAA50431.1 mandelate racemase [Shinella sp. JR1-6]WPE24196.1 Cis-3-hydroxy-L-proline dehydratase [Shinella zoogloeoides]
MKITGVDIYKYTVGYAHGTYVMSGDRVAATEDGTVIRIRTDQGLEGWGEITTLGKIYLPTFPDGIRIALKDLSEALIGTDPTNIGMVNRIMAGTLMGQEFAKSPIDIACWDILGKSLGRPISALIGGVLNDRFPIYEAVPLAAPESMGEFIRERRAAGINRFQLKVGNNPMDDIARTRASVEAGDSETIIVADSNGGWSLASAKLALQGMAGLAVYVEQPCRSTADCILAHRGSALPLVLDESIVNHDEIYRAKYEANAVSVNLKFGKLGGLTNTIKARDLLQELNMAVSVEDMWGGDIITAATSHVAATTRPESLLMTPFFNDWTDGHVASYLPRSSNGFGSAPTGPGLGIEVEVDKLEHLFTVGRA